jgi:hypothetical protein
MRDENQPKNVDDTSAYVDGIQNPDSPPPTFKITRETGLTFTS